MDFGGALSNPLVLAAGAGIGLIILLNAGGGGSSEASPAAINAASVNNQAAMRAVTDQANISAGVEKARFNADVSKQANVLSWIKNADDNQTQVALQTMRSQQAIAQSSIASHTAIVVDQQQNNARLGMAWMAARTERDKINASVTIAQIQAKTARKAITWNSITDIATTAIKTAPAFI